MTERRLSIAEQTNFVVGLVVAGAYERTPTTETDLSPPSVRPTAATAIQRTT